MNFWTVIAAMKKIRRCQVGTLKGNFSRSVDVFRPCGFVDEQSVCESSGEEDQPALNRNRQEQRQQVRGQHR